MCCTCLCRVENERLYLIYSKMKKLGLLSNKYLELISALPIQFCFWPALQRDTWTCDKWLYCSVRWKTCSQDRESPVAIFRVMFCVFVRGKRPNSIWHSCIISIARCQKLIIEWNFRKLLSQLLWFSFVVRITARHVLNPVSLALCTV